MIETFPSTLIGLGLLSSFQVEPPEVVVAALWQALGALLTLILLYLRHEIAKYRRRVSSLKLDKGDGQVSEEETGEGIPGFLGYLSDLSGRRISEGIGSLGVEPDRRVVDSSPKPRTFLQFIRELKDEIDH